jgi:hypothetical protein
MIHAILLKFKFIFSDNIKEIVINNTSATIFQLQVTFFF